MIGTLWVKNALEASGTMAPLVRMMLKDLMVLELYWIRQTIIGQDLETR